MIWVQTRRGKALDLLNPDPLMIDFAEIAETLAHLPRYAGNFEKPITVAEHTLIVFDASAPEDRPAALLHDAHEAFIGDIVTPTAKALEHLAGHLRGPAAAAAVGDAIRALKLRLDVAVAIAAGLDLPNEAQRKRLLAADLRALQTERRDFLARSPRPWAASVEAHLPLPKTYRLRPPMEVARDLHRHFKQYLPALNRRAA